MAPYTSSSSKPVVTPGSKLLQDQLHDLISRLTLASDHIKNWNESHNHNSNNNNSDVVVASHAHTHNAMVHAETTSRFIVLVQDVMTSLQKVETTLKTNTELRQTLMNIHVPIDLLELMDYTNMNPDLYLRGLVNEATQQLVGLQRRKSALHLLSTTIENRLNENDKQKAEQQVSVKDTSTNSTVLELTSSQTQFATKDTPDINVPNRPTQKDDWVSDGHNNNNIHETTTTTAATTTMISTKRQSDDTIQTEEPQPATKKQRL
jgi:Transcription factor subunit Med10 of Mediator complex